MFKRIVLAGALALFSIGPAAAGSLTTSQHQPDTTPPANSAAVTACVAQMQGLARLNKVLAANYNAEHVYDECEGQSR